MGTAVDALALKASIMEALGQTGCSLDKSALTGLKTRLTPRCTEGYCCAFVVLKAPK